MKRFMDWVSDRWEKCEAYANELREPWSSIMMVWYIALIMAVATSPFFAVLCAIGAIFGGCGK